MSGVREASPVAPRRPSAPSERLRNPECLGTKHSALGLTPSRTRLVPAWSSPRLSSSNSSSARGGGQSRGRRRCSAPAAAAEAAAAAQEGAALKPMPVHAGLVGSGEGGGAGAVAGPGPWLRHGPGDSPRFLFFLLQARVGDGPPPPPQRAARRGRSESAAAATGRSGIVAARGGGRRERGRERRHKDCERVRRSVPSTRAPRLQPAWALRVWSAGVDPQEARPAPASNRRPPRYLCAEAPAGNQSQPLTAASPTLSHQSPSPTPPARPALPPHWLRVRVLWTQPATSRAQSTHPRASSCLLPPPPCSE